MNKEVKMNECSCNQCKGACTYKPGWFKPYEIAPAAKLLGLTIEKFFKTKLAIDWWESDEPTFLLAPALQGAGTGTEYPGNPKGKCVFFKEGLCEIHTAKPFECAEYMHIDTNETVQKRHREVFESWKDHQDIIEKLLGRKPVAEEWSGGPFGHLFG